VKALESGVAYSQEDQLSKVQPDLSEVTAAIRLAYVI
jgi:hypothetical protein